MSDSKLDLTQADEILVRYATPFDNTVDNGNLFFAANEFKSAYEGLKKALETMGDGPNSKYKSGVDAIEFAVHCNETAQAALEKYK